LNLLAQNFEGHSDPFRTLLVCAERVDAEYAALADILAREDVVQLALAS
jgi:hypothetical protein